MRRRKLFHWPWSNRVNSISVSRENEDKNIFEEKSQHELKNLLMNYWVFIQKKIVPKRKYTKQDEHQSESENNKTKQEINSKTNNKKPKKFLRFSSPVDWVSLFSSTKETFGNYVNLENHANDVTRQRINQWSRYCDRLH